MYQVVKEVPVWGVKHHVPADDVSGKVSPQDGGKHIVQILGNACVCEYFPDCQQGGDCILA